MNLDVRVGVFFSIALVLVGQQVLAKNSIDAALHNAEKALCKVVKSKNCAQKKSKKPTVQNLARQKTSSPVMPAIDIKAKAPLLRVKSAPPEVIPTEPTIEVAPEPIPPEPILREAPLVVPKSTAPASKTPQLPPVLISNSVQCQGALTKLNVTFAPNPAYQQQGSCLVADPVQLVSYTLNGQKLEFPDQPILNCAFAVQFISFVQVSAGPTIASQTTSQIAKLYTGPGFVCRGRNGDLSGKLSEHALGNAVDIERIQLSNGRTMLVKDAISFLNKDYAVLNAVRHAACTYFTTVLGPGANEAHASHFHFDLGQHGKSGTYRICE